MSDPKKKQSDAPQVEATVDLRAALLQTASNIPEETIVVGDGLKVLVRGMLARDADQMMTRAAEKDGGLQQMYPQFVVIGAHDPDTGKRLFRESDIDAILSMPAQITNEIATATMRLSGLTDEAKKDAGKDSASTDDDAPSSS